MSDFVQTMKDWRRMCNTIQSKNQKASIGSWCKGCPLQDFCIIDTSIKDTTNGEFDIIGEQIQTWAAENQEPVYPTWGEWLMEQMVIAERMRPKYDYTNGERTDELERTGEYIAIDSEMKKQIPADIAEKLGLKPKE